MSLFDYKAQNFEEVYHVKDITSQEMKNAISEWSNLYYGRNVPEDEDPCQRIPFTVVNKILKGIFSEYSAECKDEFAQKVLDGLKKIDRSAMQKALIGGSVLLKPVLLDDKVTFTVIAREDYIPLGRDLENNLTDVGLAEHIERRGNFFTLYERRYINDEGKLTIDTRLFKSETKHNLGGQVPLTYLPETENLIPINELNIDNIGLIEVRNPSENCIDGTDDAVSVYAPAVELIHNININEAQMFGEFVRGESRIIVSNDMLKRDVLGNKSLEDNVFTGVDDDPENVGINIFSPALREQSFLARKTEYLRNVENIVGLKRGLLSEVETAERTATEITSSAGDYNLTIIDFQRVWENAVKQCVFLCIDIAGVYKVKASKINEDDIIVSWGNGILYDEDKEWQDRFAMVAAGLLKPELALAWKFNLPAETPNDIAKIRADYMPDLLALTEQNA